MSTQTLAPLQTRTTAALASSLQPPAPSGRRAATILQADDTVAAVPEDGRPDDVRSQEPPSTEEPLAPAPALASASDVVASDAAAADAKAGDTACRQVHVDGTEGDCSPGLVWPWMAAGAAVLLAGAGAHGSEDHTPMGVQPPLTPVTPITPVTPPVPVTPPTPVDPVVPAHPDVHAPTLTLAHDNGALTNDGLTNDGTVAVSDLTPGATWFYRVNDAADWTQGKGDLVPGSALVAGQNVIEAYQVGADGKPGPLTSLAVTLDLAPPEAPLPETSNGLPLINAQDSLLIHRLEDARIWEYRIDGGNWVGGTGDSLATDALHEGSQTVDVRQTDLAGNVSEVASLAVTLDSVAPDVLLASAHRQDGTAAAGNLINASGHVSLDNLEPNATWEFKLNGDDQWRPGSGTQLPSALLAEGANAVDVRQIDAAGNAGAERTTAVVLDTIAPVAPTLKKVFPNALDSLADHVDVTQLEPDSTWWYRVDRQGDWVQGSGSAVSVDVFVDPPNTLAYHTLEVYQIDAAGNPGLAASTQVKTWTPPPAGI